jgi:hypothetical protein
MRPDEDEVSPSTGRLRGSARQRCVNPARRLHASLLFSYWLIKISDTNSKRSISKLSFLTQMLYRKIWNACLLPWEGVPRDDNYCLRHGCTSPAACFFLDESFECRGVHEPRRWPQAFARPVQEPQFTPRLFMEASCRTQQVLAKSAQSASRKSPYICKIANEADRR